MLQAALQGLHRKELRKEPSSAIEVPLLSLALLRCTYKGRGGAQLSSLILGEFIVGLWLSLYEF